MHFDGVIFPGQGSQYLGMGKDFTDHYEHARTIFNLANNTLDFNLYEICQKDESKLNNTEYTQPCILTVEIAMYQVLKYNHGIAPTTFAGHSLGEYTALVAAEVIPFDIALQIVNFRGKLMQNAVMQNHLGSMVAIIANPLPPLEQIKQICNKFAVDIANDNSIQQVVLSGYSQEVKAAVTDIETTFLNHSLKIVYLNVNTPFHSRYMKKIEAPFKEYLLQFKNKFNTNNLTNVISNYIGEFYPDTTIELLVEYLTKQISGSIKWQQNMNALLKRTKNILEIGPTATLRGFFKPIGINISSITNINSLNKMFVNV